MIEVLAIDLDLTLVNTSYLDPFRNNRDWQGAISNIRQTRLYSNVANFFREVDKLRIPIVVVSNSPSHYVYALLDHHRLNPDMVISYHDMASPKPSADWFRLVKDKYDCHPNNVVFIGNEDTDLFAAKNAGVDFYGVSWGTYSEEVNQGDFSNLLEKIFSFSGNNTYRLRQERDLYFCGYYQSRSDDFANKSVRSFLLNYKDGIETSLSVWSGIMPAIAGRLPKADLVVRALGHAECMAQPSGRDTIWSTLAIHIQGEYLPTALQKRHVTRKSTGLGRNERFAEARNSYEVALADRVLQAKSILIVDDVYTTGATIEEVKRALREVNPQANLYAFTLLRTNNGWNQDAQEITTVNTQLLSLLNRPPVVFNFPAVPDFVANVNDYIEAGPVDFLETTDEERQKIPLYVNSAHIEKTTRKKLTASYTGHGSNFVLHNLPRHGQTSADLRYIAAAKVIKNILLRGTPTRPSRYLTGALGDWKGLPSGSLLSLRSRKWNTFQGDQSFWDNHLRAVYTLISSALTEDLADGNRLNAIFLPFVPASDIVSGISSIIADTKLDLVFPEINLVIQVRDELNSYDYRLNDVLSKNGYEIVYFSPASVFAKDHAYTESISRIQSYLTWLESAEYTLEEPTCNQTALFRDMKVETASPQDGAITASWGYQEVIQIQVAVLELIILGHIEPNRGVTIPTQGIRHKGSAKLAIDDLNLWFQHICRLQDLPFEDVMTAEEADEFSEQHEGMLKLDIDILASGSDTIEDQSSTVYIRRDAFGKIIARTASSYSQSAIRVQAQDYFELEVSEPISYTFNHHSIEAYQQSLEFILQNVFFPKQEGIHFREGQLGIVLNSLRRKNTIGLLPTGSGKSVCYQLSALLQPAISFVVCPIKSLMYDQKADLDAIGITRTNYITSDQSKKEKDGIQREFSQGRYFFIFISPERFQGAAFREELRQISQFRSFAYAVIDEVHCLSEWGHDFRTSYLNLAKTIDRFAPEATYIGLTATASVNVLSDIQKEFNTPDSSVKTPPFFGREELVFNVIDDQGKKYPALLELLKQLNHNLDWLSDKQNHAGIIFTNTVNGDKGCARLATSLSTELDTPVEFYAGSKPTDWNTANNFEAYRSRVQRDFKANKFKLLTATKAFGMGINKANISYTVHFGIPSSMEALYQEAGRAGRDKVRYLQQNAQCYVLLGADSNIHRLDKLWEPDTTVQDLEKTRKICSKDGDLDTAFFLLLSGTMAVNDEYALIRHVYDIIAQSSDSEVTLDRKSLLGNSLKRLDPKKADIEKAIFRLSLLGVVEDWTVEYIRFDEKRYVVQVGDTSPSNMAKTLEASIQKYEADFTLASLESNSSDKLTFLRQMRNTKPDFGEAGYYITVLLTWSLDHFTYSRRQSLKTVYEQCHAASAGKITSEQFKQALEGYFQFSESSDFLKQVADEPGNIEQCFQVFYEQGHNTPTLLENDELLRLKEQLSRFLESYKNNPGLDLISGILRLKFNDFNDVDGERRYHAALQKITDFSLQRQAGIIRQISTVFKSASLAQQDTLVRSTAQVIDSIHLLNIFNEVLSEGIADTAILNQRYSRLSSLMTRLGQAA